MSWSAIIGGRKTDKTAAALAVARALRARGLAVGGFVQRDVLGPAGESVGIDVERVDGTARTSLARTSPTPELCDYAFDPRGFAQAAAWASEPCDVVIIGGVGKLEAARTGHFEVLARLASAPSGPHVLACVRDSCLSPIGLLLPDAEAWVELPCEDAALADFVEAIAARQRSDAG
jgi:nucleoside-triphosphatase THEP1